MSRLDLRILKKEDIPDLVELWEAVYPNRDLPEIYWEWMFDCPLPWVSSGIYKNDKLLAHYGAVVHGEYGHTFSSMSHPDYRHQGLYQKAAIHLYTELMWHYNCDYATFFSNKPIHRTHKRMGALNIYRIRECRIPIESIKKEQGLGFYPYTYKSGSYEEWRYNKHPLKTYIYYQNKINNEYIIMNKYENRLQIIDCSNIEKVLGLAAFIGFLLECTDIVFWVNCYSEYKFKYPSLLLDEWFMLYPIESDLNIHKLLEQKRREKIWMGMHDSY